MYKEKNIPYLMWKQIIIRAAAVRQRKTSIRLACKWPTTQMLLLPFARQTYNVRLLHDNHKTGSTATMGIARCGCLLIKLYMTPTTRTSIVRLSNVALSITSTRFLKLRSATVATSGKTCSTRTYTKDVRPVVTEA